MKKTVITVTVIMASLLTSDVIQAKRLNNEKFYQEQWCQEHSGKMEKVLEDGTRCDCVTETHAVEMDFADNWYEAVGQSTHYSLQTENKRAGIVLILESPDDKRHWERLINLVDKAKFPIDVWAVGDGVDPEMEQPHEGAPTPVSDGVDSEMEQPHEDANNGGGIGSDCEKLPTIKLERTGSSVKWLIHIPCLIDTTGTFGEKPQWATFGSKQREDGDLLFGVDDYGYVE